MSNAPLVDVASKSFMRRGVTYDQAWWLVPHSSISHDRFNRARRELLQSWTEEAAQAGEFHATGSNALMPVVDSLPRSSLKRLA